MTAMPHRGVMPKEDKMSDTAPEFAWLEMPDTFDEMGVWFGKEGRGLTKYRRADLPATEAQIMAHPKIKLLMDAARRVATADWVYTGMIDDMHNILLTFPDAIKGGAEMKATDRLTVACAACGWTGKRLPGQTVQCPKCGAMAAFQHAAAREDE